ncbi:MAG: NUDIX hydrolase [Sphaerochaetaceae bacterium]|nr:NUDIX hydrolase [Spirochaetaceae bacterium]MDY6345064.1 NUDIX hydrolase [Sphaerochaetaceae bacterium]
MNDPFLMGDPLHPDHLVWKDDGQEKLAWHGPIFDVTLVKRSSTDGRTGDFCRVESPEWITVIPWYRNEEGKAMFVMEQQFRHGSATVTREFPAGLVEKGEDPKVAAARELLEETGSKAEKLEEIGNVSPNSAFMGNRSHFYLAEGLSHVEGQNLDPNEQLDVLSIPVEEVLRDIGTGMYDNGIMLMAACFFLKECAKRPGLRDVPDERSRI